MRRQKLLRRLATLGVLVAILAIWKLYVVLADVSPLLLPSPETVVEGTYSLLIEPSSLNHMRITLTETLLGFAIAAVAGVAVGTILGKMATLEAIVQPYVVATQVIPKIALAPLFVLWFGFGMNSKIFLAALLGFFPIVTNTILGIKSVSRDHADVMRSMSATKLQTFRFLDLPSALPSILAGMEVGIVLSQIGAIVGEYLGGSSGLGFMAIQTLNELQIGRLFGVIALLTIMGYLLYSAVGLVQRYAIPWHDSVALQKSLGGVS